MTRSRIIAIALFLISTVAHSAPAQESLAIAGVNFQLGMDEPDVKQKLDALSNLYQVKKLDNNWQIWSKDLNVPVNMLGSIAIGRNGRVIELHRTWAVANSDDAYGMVKKLYTALSGEAGGTPMPGVKTWAHQGPQDESYEVRIGTGLRWLEFSFGDLTNYGRTAVTLTEHIEDLDVLFLPGNKQPGAK